MENNLHKSKLFAGMSAEEIDGLLQCVGAKTKNYPKGGVIYSEGDTLTHVALVLSGQALVVSYDHWGNRSLYAEVGQGDIFGAAYGAGGVLPVSFITETGCEVVLISYPRLIVPCGNSCARHQKILGNIINILSVKNMTKLEKIGHLSKRTTREKILSYLSSAARSQGSRIFTIPFSRQALADYLAVDRSALSRELSRLKAGGVIDYNKNTFSLRHLSGAAC